MVQLTRVAVAMGLDEVLRIQRPPPLLVAELPLRVQFVSVASLAVRYTPPPEPTKDLESMPMMGWTLFPLRVELEILTVASSANTPPPLEAELPLTAQLVSVVWLS